jgi:hypothetical protein
MGTASETTGWLRLLLPSSNYEYCVLLLERVAGLGLVGSTGDNLEILLGSWLLRMRSGLGKLGRYLTTSLYFLCINIIQFANLSYYSSSMRSWFWRGPLLFCHSVWHNSEYSTLNATSAIVYLWIEVARLVKIYELGTDPKIWFIINFDCSSW